MPIHVINANEILGAQLMADPMANATVAAAYQKHVFRGLDMDALLPADPRSVDPRVHVSSTEFLDAERARVRGEHVYEYIGMARSMQQMVVADWLSELHIRDSRLFGALHKMSFGQMIGHSKKWHAAIAKRAANLRDHGIPEDPEGAPIVLDVGGDWEGWSVVWLKSDESRDTEGFVMGHCVGGGHYDRLGSLAAVFSFRDPKNVLHATIYVDARDETNSYGLGRGNAKLAERYVMPVEHIMVLMSLRMNLKGAPDKAIEDGNHADRRGWVYHIRNELLHCEDGPAKFDPNGLEEHWYRDGLLSRANGDLPTIIYGDGYLEFWDDDGENCEPDHPVRKIEAVSVTTEYYSGGKLHREGGPARIRERGHGLRDDVEFWQHGVQVMEDGSPFPMMESRGYYTVTKENGERQTFEMGPLSEITITMDHQFVPMPALDTTQEMPR